LPGVKRRGTKWQDRHLAMRSNPKGLEQERKDTKWQDCPLAMRSNPKGLEQERKDTLLNHVTTILTQGADCYATLAMNQGLVVTIWIVKKMKFTNNLLVFD